MRFFFFRAGHCSGGFPRGSGLRSKSSARGGPEASFFSSFRALFPPFFFGRFILYLVRLKPFVQFDSALSLNSHRCNSRLWAKSAFPLLLQFRWSTQPALSLPGPPFFSPWEREKCSAGAIVIGVLSSDLRQMSQDGAILDFH